MNIHLNCEQIFVPPPDDASREQIFRLELRKAPLHSDVDFQSLTTLSEGFSGAEIASVCSEAAMLAIENSEKTVIDSDSMTCLCMRMSDLQEAISATKPQITKEMISFYSALAQRFQ